MNKLTDQQFEDVEDYASIKGNTSKILAAINLIEVTRPISEESQQFKKECMVAIEKFRRANHRDFNKSSDKLY